MILPVDRDQPDTGPRGSENNQVNGSDRKTSVEVDAELSTVKEDLAELNPAVLPALTLNRSDFHDFAQHEGLVVLS